MFSKVLVANRGEIARRIFRACRELGVRSVAIYSEVDRSAPWARQADESYILPGVTARETYLNQQLIIDIAQAAGAERIDGVLVQKMAEPGFELLVGATQDPVFGVLVRGATGEPVAVDHSLGSDLRSGARAM